MGYTIDSWQRLGGPSHNPSGIPSMTIVDGEIVVGDINCPVAETKWAGSQSNCGTWACVTLLR